MEIIDKKVSDLIPYVNNARNHPDEQILQIAASIKEFGFVNPILLDGANGVVAGHGRLAGAKKLNMDTVPCIELSHLSEAQKRGYIIADNQLTLTSEWNTELLGLEIENLKDLDFDIDLLGFDDGFLEDILNDVEEVEFPELADGDKEPFQQVTYTLHDEQHKIVMDAVLKAKTHPVIDTGLNENSNGNAITYICEQWLNNVS